jgi:hypothetical protein
MSENSESFSPFLSETHLHLVAKCMLNIVGSF